MVASVRIYEESLLVRAAIFSIVIQLSFFKKKKMGEHITIYAVLMSIYFILMRKVIHITNLPIKFL